MKQMHLGQLMGLKSKGRFLQETKMFEIDNKTIPSIQSQKIVVGVIPNPNILSLYIEATIAISE